MRDNRREEKKEGYVTLQPQNNVDYIKWHKLYFPKKNINAPLCNPTMLFIYTVYKNNKKKLGLILTIEFRIFSLYPLN